MAAKTNALSDPDTWREFQADRDRWAEESGLPGTEEAYKRKIAALRAENDLLRAMLDTLFTAVETAQGKGGNDAAPGGNDE